MAFREAEAYSFVLENGPAWLRCGETSGVLQGIPGPQDVGEHEVVVGIAATYPEEVSEAEDPNGHFQKRRTKPQYRVAGSHRFVLQTVNAGE